MIVKQYFPSFFVGFNPKVNEVNSIEELFDLDYIKRASKLPGFYRFSYDHWEGDNRLTLMCEEDYGKKWYVIAYIYQFREIEVGELPKWRS